jgi:hypothetical protein
MGERIVAWFSHGAASAVAAKLTLRRYGAERVVVALCDTRSEDPDNERFEADCTRWFGVPVVKLGSTEYADTWDVWTKRRYLAGIDGAPCTVALKVVPRLEFQRPTDTHVFGYTLEEAKRGKLFRDNYPELTVEYPLIEAGLRKADCLAMVENAGIELPALYKLGFQNNNCMPCVKATSPAYWALVRKVRPEHFARMAALSRELNVRLCRIKNERRFIDEIPDDWPTVNPIVPTCDFLCAIAEQEMANADAA